MEDYELASLDDKLHAVKVTCDETLDVDQLRSISGAKLIITPSNALKLSDLCTNPHNPNKAIQYAIDEQLEKVDLSGFYIIDNVMMKKLTTNNNKIKQLQLGPSGFLTDNAIIAISKLEKLEKLDLAFCPKLTKAALTTIVLEHPNLESLDLADSKLTGKEITNIILNLKNPKSLNLSYCNLTRDDILTILSKHTNLESLGIARSGNDKKLCVASEKDEVATAISNLLKLQSLNLNGWSGISEIISNLPISLNKLSLSNDKVRSSEIESALLKQPLDSLDLRGCRNLRQYGAHELKKKFPNCEIIF